MAGGPADGWTPAGWRGEVESTAGRAPVAVVACHGGAGASTVARLLEPAMDLAWVRDWVDYAARWQRHMVPLVLVARGTAAGTAAATETLAGAVGAGLRPAVLVVVVDGPWPEPRAARARIRLMAGRVGAVVRLPYVPRWRYVEDPLAEPIPNKIAAAVDAIRAAAGA